jgi:hypothetical protein
VLASYRSRSGGSGEELCLSLGVDPILQVVY